MAQGHVIPTLDMARLFGSRGVKISVITTHGNAPLLSKTIERGRASGIEMELKTIKFPWKEVGLPEGCENVDVITKERLGMETFFKFFKAVNMLQEQLEELLRDFKPDCLVADMFFPWATDSAAKFGIPRLVFHGTCFFSLCTVSFLANYEPHKKVSTDSEPFIVPELPGQIAFTRNQLPDSLKMTEENEFTRLVKQMREAEVKSYGVVVNSFYELEPDYADCYRNVLGRKAWHIGPVSLCNRDFEDKASRGKQASSIDCLKWLDSKKPNSVVYICFGSVANFNSEQLMQIAIGLESSGQDFIWVVRKDEEEEEDWLPEGFEKRMEGKGVIIRGWAPQVLILEHEALGGFVTHCGWNSTLEGITAGVPMVTWPVSADQFYNEKLVTDVIEIGVAVGVGVKECVKSDAIERAVKEIMVGDKADEMRKRAKALGELAKKAVVEDGSSYCDLNALIRELSF